MLDIEVYGREGGPCWRQQDPQSLLHLRPGEADRRLHRGVDDLDPDCAAAMRRPRPHPEGFREAFANIYAAFGASVAARLTGRRDPEGERAWPGPDSALRGLRFVEARLASRARAGRVRVGAADIGG